MEGLLAVGFTLPHLKAQILYVSGADGIKVMIKAFKLT
jgi:hypothetical protein